MVVQRVVRRLRRDLPPSWFGYRYLEKETVPEYFARQGHSNRGPVGRYETIHPEAIAENPLPCNISSRDGLPLDRGWWGYSFHDVPVRTSGETFIATLPDCRVVPSTDARGEFWVTLINRHHRALALREMSFRSWQAPFLRSRQKVPVKRATWILERVYHNHSHWLTAHLPKLLLLQSRGEEADVYLPPKLTPAIEQSLRLYGFAPERFPTFDPLCPLEVEELTVLGTDRFRPELLRLVREACPIPAPENPHRRVFISRSKAPRRRLVNEEVIWPLLKRAGFERVYMEALSFEAQIRLMRETAILVAPHGAGLTNMMFCPPGTHVVELADLGFPNPNFYAVASAMGHHFWLLAAEALGDMHPLEKDLKIEPEAIEDLLSRLI